MGEKTITYGHYKPFLRVKHQSGLEDVHYSLTYEGFPDEFKLMAERELKETDDGRKQSLQKLQESMKSQGMPVLKDELLSLAVLRICKYNMAKSEAKLKNFLQEKAEIIEKLAELGMKKIECIIDDMPFGMLPYRDKHGRAILYTRPYGARLDQYEFNDVGLVMTAGLLFVMSYPITSVAGIAYYGECKCPSFYLYYSIFKSFKKYMFHVLSIPVRIARVEVLNENHLCRCFHKMASTILSKKIIDRVSLHGSSFDYFHELYHPDILPEDFGGNMGPVRNDAYKRKLLDFITALINDNHC